MYTTRRTQRRRMSRIAHPPFAFILLPFLNFCRIHSRRPVWASADNSATAEESCRDRHMPTVPFPLLLSHPVSPLSHPLLPPVLHLLRRSTHASDSRCFRYSQYIRSCFPVFRYTCFHSSSRFFRYSCYSCHSHCSLRHSRKAAIK